MSIPKERTLEPSEVAERMQDLGSIQRYIEDTWGNGTPDDLFDLEVQMIRILELVNTIQQEKLASGDLAPDQVARIRADMERWLENDVKYFAPLARRARREHPNEATEQWIREYREPYLHGQFPDGRTAVPFTMIPFIALNEIVQAQVMGQSLAQYNVFDFIDPAWRRSFGGELENGDGFFPELVSPDWMDSRFWIIAALLVGVWYLAGRRK